jgi:hypothetical protein
MDYYVKNLFTYFRLKLVIFNLHEITILKLHFENIIFYTQFVFKLVKLYFWMLVYYLYEHVYF